MISSTLSLKLILIELVCVPFEERSVSSCVGSSMTTNGWFKRSSGNVSTFFTHRRYVTTSNLLMAFSNIEVPVKAS